MRFQPIITNMCIYTLGISQTSFFPALLQYSNKVIKIHPVCMQPFCCFCIYLHSRAESWDTAHSSIKTRLSFARPHNRLAPIDSFFLKPSWIAPALSAEQLIGTFMSEIRAFRFACQYRLVRQTDQNLDFYSFNSAYHNPAHRALTLLIEIFQHN